MDMTADDSEPTNEPVRSETDLRLEALEGQLSDMRAAYEKQIAELKEANRGLWAALHPVQEAQPAPAGPVPGEAAYTALADKLGLEATKE
jgi:hypothetical protein